MRVLGCLQDPVWLISQTCLETGARVSEVTGLRIQHVDLELGCVRIEQRHWRRLRRAQDGAESADAGTGEPAGALPAVDRATQGPP